MSINQASLIRTNGSLYQKRWAEHRGDENKRRRTEKLVRQPAQSRAWHDGQYSRCQPSPKTSNTIPLPYYSKGIKHSLDVADICVLCCSPRLQHCFCHIERCRHTRCHATCDSTGGDVGCRRVLASRIDEALYLFVHCKLYCIEGYRYGQCRRVRHVKGRKSFIPEDDTRTCEDRLEFRFVYLHSLFDN